jgi:RNA 3'-terminal phosphate cyclase (ATP)
VSDEVPILLDGSAGEGGGQILRTALSLSSVTGKPFAVHRIRANRIKPGLRPQHREALRAADRLCGAELVGDEVGSSRVEFRPQQRAAPGEYVFDIGTAGSTPLLLQVLCWPLALAGGASQLTLRGGTHQLYSPTFHDLALVWAPAVARLGFGVELSLQAAGFYPEGGGEFTVRVDPAHAMPPLDLRHRGTLREVEVVSMVAGLGFEAAERQMARVQKRLRDMGISADGQCVPVPAHSSKGGHVMVVSSFERTRAGQGATGDRSKSPERVADEAVQAFQGFLDGRAAVDRFLGDQLLIPASLAAAGLVPGPPGVIPVTRYTVSAVTKHLLTSAEVIRRFLDVEIAVLGREGDEGEVRIQPPGAGAEVLRFGGV